MERGMNPSLVEHEGRVIGVNLDSDACAEHEFGIGGLKRALGMPLDPLDPKTYGLKGRTVTKFEPKQFFYRREEDASCLVFQANGIWFDNWRHLDLEQMPMEVSAAWDDGGFGIVVPNEHAQFLADLFLGFQNRNAALWLGGGRAFKNPGLQIFIASRLPAEADQGFLEVDVKRYSLKQAAEATGIEKVLKEAGKEYFALSPRWADEAETVLEFWLNPSDQQNNNYGWFSLEELRDWIKGKGPIPKKQQRGKK